MNYIDQIRRMEKDAKVVSVELCGLKCGIDDIKDHLRSAQARREKNIDISEVFRLIDEAERKADTLKADQIRINERR